MAPLNKARELAKREAAKKRKQSLKVDKENINGLSSVILVKIETLKINEINRQKNNPNIMTGNKARRINDQQQWNQPFDWRFVTENTLYKYIPFEENINISQAMDYVTDKLKQHEPSTKIIKAVDKDTPIWYMSRNAIRSALYRASIQRRIFNDLRDLSSAHSIYPVSNLGGEL